MFNLTLFAWVLLVPMCWYQFVWTVHIMSKDGLRHFVFPFWYVGWFVIATCIGIIGA